MPGTGARLPAERDLARQLGVSRPSVREALIALEVEGWVEVRTGSGVYVQDRTHRSAERVAATEWGPLELIRARRVVEGASEEAVDDGPDLTDDETGAQVQDEQGEVRAS